MHSSCLHDRRIYRLLSINVITLHDVFFNQYCLLKHVRAYLNTCSCLI